MRGSSEPTDNLIGMYHAIAMRLLERRKLLLFSLSSRLVKEDRANEGKSNAREAMDIHNIGGPYGMMASRAAN